MSTEPFGFENNYKRSEKHGIIPLKKREIRGRNWFKHSAGSDMNATTVKYAAINENELTNDTCATIERGFVAEKQWHPWKHCPNNCHDAEDKRGKLVSFFLEALDNRTMQMAEEIWACTAEWRTDRPRPRDKTERKLSFNWTAEPTICDSICDYGNSLTISLWSPLFVTTKNRDVVVLVYRASHNGL